MFSLTWEEVWRARSTAAMRHESPAATGPAPAPASTNKTAPAARPRRDGTTAASHRHHPKAAAAHAPRGPARRRSAERTDTPPAPASTVTHRRAMRAPGR